MKKVIPIASLLFPLIAGAQTISDFLGGTLTDIINVIIQFLIVVASLIFIFGVIRYIAAANDPEKRTEARQFVIYALMGLVIILVFWGLVTIVVNSLNLDNSAPRDVITF